MTVRKRSLRKPTLKTTARIGELEYEIWKRGQLSGKLLRPGREIYEGLRALEAKGDKRITLLAGRRGQKTWALCVLMLEHAFRNPGHIIRYVGKTAKSIRKNLKEPLEQLLADCPGPLQPDMDWDDGAIFFTNGSIIYFSGADAHGYDKDRGGKSHLVICDESQDIADLNIVVIRIFAPQLLDTHGLTILSGTAPSQPNHSMVQFITDARANGTIVEKTIFDRHGDTPEEEVELQRQLAQAIQDCGGAQSDEFRREYCNELIFDSEFRVVPEWTPEVEKLLVVESYPRPAHFHTYVALDPGYTHSHMGVLFGFWDFEEQTLVIEDAMDIPHSLISIVGPLIIKKERELWGHLPPYYRVMDIEPGSQGEMRRGFTLTEEDGRTEHVPLFFHSVAKKDPKSDAAKVRRLVTERKIAILSKAKPLIANLHGATWDKTERERGTYQLKFDKKHGHWDVYAALSYLVKSIRRSENPFPFEPATQQRQGQFTPTSYNPATGQRLNPSSQVVGLSKLFNRGQD